MSPAKQARQRAEVILKVRSGRMTAAQGARLLGVSRKSYYQWEQRGLADRPAGRPSRPRDREKERLRRELSRMEQRLIVLEQTAKLRNRLRQFDRQDAKKNAKR